ncbi:SBBP repeat-containing protein [Niastella sp. OAS944]|uniref:SBBP repeat-containing protein n=1 Tax=Niastella sp. OAS944 TaxID=2664089 RepID=UPI00347127B4|nr:putative delta-60 repeat protein [Chitinophagaceae bacterium OAS944]
MSNVLLLRKPLLLASILFSSALCFAQVTQQWVQRQNGEPNAPDVANDLEVDHNGNVYVTGSSQGKGTNADFTTIKYDNNSNTQWVKRYNGPVNGEDQATAIVVDHKGNVYVTGWSTGSGTSNDFTTIKYDYDGNTKWVKRYNGPGNQNDRAVAITVDENCNVYITGWSIGSGTATDYTTIKYDENGDTKWVKRYNGPANSTDLPTAIAVDHDGNVYVTGQSAGSGTSADYATIKYNANGNQLWVTRYNGPVNGLDRANALAVDHNGNVYVTGLTATFSDEDGSLFDIATIKYNASGIQQWAAMYNRKGHDEANDLALDAAGNVYITGFSGNEEEDPDNDYVTIKYNAAGAQQWASIFSGPGGDQSGEATDLVLDASGNVYITGGISIEQATDYATIKYNNNGVQQWVATYDGPGNELDKANAIGLDGNGNVFITGLSRLDGFGNGDYATIKYTPGGGQKWLKRYNGPTELKGDHDYATALAVDGGGNVHVTGGIRKNSTGFDYTTYKYDGDGDRDWKKTYNGPGNGPDEASDITLDAQGNVYVTGHSDGLGTSLDYATIKYGADGDTKWSKRYNGPGNSFDQATAIAVDPNGNVYVTGTSVGSGTSDDYATIKYDNNGNTQWIRRYNGPDNSFDRATAIGVDQNGNVYVTGWSRGIGTFQDYTTIKYDANGNELWVARYNAGTNTSEEATALAVDALGNVYVTGTGNPMEFSPVDYVTIKYNTAGVQLWVARYGTADIDEPTDIAVDAVGNVFVTGGSAGDYATVKYNTAGAQQWDARLALGIANALALDAAGNVYVTGANRLSNITPDDYVTIKYNTAGVQQWLTRYDGPANSVDVATDIAVDDDGFVYVTGRSTGIGTGYDYATIKYAQTPLITTRQQTLPNTSGAMAEPAKLHAWAYPNSFTQYINLQWSGNNDPVSITITDIMGKQVERRSNLPSSGTLKTGAQLSAGIYYAVIVQGADKVVLRLMKTN